MKGKITPQDHYHQQPKPILHHAMRLILVSYNNRKKHGAKPLINKKVEGAISSKGEVVLFSEELPQKGYRSLIEMNNVLGEYGDVVVDYIDKGTQDAIPNLSLLTKIVLRDLIQGGLHEHKVHDLIWYYASKYRDGDTEQELKNLMAWLESEEA